MENNLEVFESEEFGKLRIVEVEGKTMFVASDVAKMLGYAKPANAISKHCRYALKRGIPHPQGSGTLQVNIIPEGDVYRLIVNSKLPNAQKFESWVFDDVLPTIRRTGSYQTKQSDEIQRNISQAMLLNAQTKQAGLWLKIAEGTGVATYKNICNAYAANTLAGAEVFPLPKSDENDQEVKPDLQEVKEKTYTATEVGDMLGITANKVGRIAKKYNLKTEEYGRWFHDKSPYSTKEVESFRYNDNGIEAIRLAAKIITKITNKDGSVTTTTPVESNGKLYEVKSTSRNGELEAAIMIKH